jgi:hypothetical protein
MSIPVLVDDTIQANTMRGGRSNKPYTVRSYYETDCRILLITNSAQVGTPTHQDHGNMTSTKPPIPLPPSPIVSRDHPEDPTRILDLHYYQGYQVVKAKNYSRKAIKAIKAKNYSVSVQHLL